MHHFLKFLQNVRQLIREGKLEEIEGKVSQMGESKADI